jgi:DNA polymerase I-like protein with 3'-5' exonuclease and polymerase domains
LDRAKEEYGEYTPLKRSGTYKALNRLIQGSAADQTKKAMIDLDKEGITPMIQIHDELAISLNGDPETQKKLLILWKTIEMSVPSKVDVAIGNNWGEAK